MPDQTITGLKKLLFVYRQELSLRHRFLWYNYFMIITKASGEKVEFSQKKYEESLHRVGLTIEEAREISSQINQDLYPNVPSDRIFLRTHQFLKKKNKIFAAKYSLKRAIMNLGPAGYFFERYMATVLAAYGYKTRYNQLVEGKCVEHEVDISAEGDGKKYMIECKYHNQSGRKSDLKVALYTYARFLDLKDKYQFSQAVLMTNTAFTAEAVKYSRCMGVKVVGWRYPQSGESLEHYIESKKLYPVTVLTSLTRQLNHRFREENIVLAVDLLKFTPQSLAKRFKISLGLAQRLISEVSVLIS